MTWGYPALSLITDKAMCVCVCPERANCILAPPSHYTYMYVYREAEREGRAEKQKIEEKEEGRAERYISKQGLDLSRYLTSQPDNQSARRETSQPLLQ